jgi:hypothetical protein
MQLHTSCTYINELYHRGRETGNEYNARKIVLKLCNRHRAFWKNKPRSNPLIGKKAAMCTSQAGKK